MIKKTTVSILLLMIAALSWAGPVDQQQAEENVRAFFTKQSKKGARGIRGISNRQKSLVLEKVSEVADAYYVFNIQYGGFVIAAADDQVPAVLGYTDNGSFDSDDIPDNMRGYLEGMAAEIQAIRQGLGTGVTSNSSDRQAIAPMVTTKWNQGNSSGNAYNYQCPQVSYTGQTKLYYSLTGCVATAMAQVMKYHEWPKEKCEEIPSYESKQKYGNINAAGTLPALPGIIFDWANMKDSYSNESETDASAIAVAQLMRYCGQSVEMKYSPAASSAPTANIALALKDYFGYDDGVRTENRTSYTFEEWNEMIYHELLEKRPVVLSGSSSGGAHAFVCDGYDTDNYFHINWGWGGSKDGYFLLSVLNPYDNSGAGASTTRDGYSYQNYAVVGIQAPDGNTYSSEIKMTAVNFSCKSTTVSCSIWNRTGETHNFNYGYAIGNEDGSFTILTEKTDNNLKTSYGHSSFEYNLADANLSDGTYYIYVVSKEASSEQWLKSSNDYFKVVVNNGNISISIPTHQLSFTSSTLVSDGFANTPQELSAKIKNTGDKEFYGRLYFFIEGIDIYEACTGATVSGNSQSDVSFFFTPTAGGTFRFWICTDSNGENKIGEGTVTFTEAEKQVYVKLTPLNMNTVDGVNYLTTTDFRAQLEIFNNTDSKQTVKLYATLKGSDHSGSWDRSYEVESKVTKTATYTSTLTEGNTYTLTVYKDKTKTDTWQAPITFTVSTSTGIQGVTDNIQEKEPVYYDLQGRIVPHPTKGIYIVNKKKVIIK